MEDHKLGIEALAGLLRGDEIDDAARGHIGTLAAALPPYDNVQALIDALNRLLKPDGLVAAECQLDELWENLDLPPSFSGYMITARPSTGDTQAYLTFMSSIKFVICADGTWRVVAVSDIIEPINDGEAKALEAIIAHAKILRAELAKVVAVLEEAHDRESLIQVSLLRCAREFLEDDVPIGEEGEDKLAGVLGMAMAELTLRTLADQLGMRYEAVLGMARKRK
jgi:hypothetical protein